MFIPLISLFFSCANNTESDTISGEIEKAETNLIPPVFIEGDSTWTIQSRMKYYSVPGVIITGIKDVEIARIKI